MTPTQFGNIVFFFLVTSRRRRGQLAHGVVGRIFFFLLFYVILYVMRVYINYTNRALNADFKGWRSVRKNGVLPRGSFVSGPAAARQYIIVSAKRTEKTTR